MLQNKENNEIIPIYKCLLTNCENQSSISLNELHKKLFWYVWVLNFCVCNLKIKGFWYKNCKNYNQILKFQSSVFHSKYFKPIEIFTTNAGTSFLFFENCKFLSFTRNLDLFNIGETRKISKISINALNEVLSPFSLKKDHVQSLKYFY